MQRCWLCGFTLSGLRCKISYKSTKCIPRLSLGIFHKCIIPRVLCVGCFWNTTDLPDDKCLLWLGRDCSDIKDSLLSVVPKIPSGIYIIHPDNTDSLFEVIIQSFTSVCWSSVTIKNTTCAAGLLWDGLHGRWMDGDAAENRRTDWLQAAVGWLHWWLWKPCRLCDVETKSRFLFQGLDPI